MVARYLHLFIIFPLSTYACFPPFVCVRHSSLAMLPTDNAFLPGVVISNCRFVPFILLLNNFRRWNEKDEEIPKRNETNKKKHIPNVVVVTWSRVLNILRCGGWKPKTEKCTKKHRAENKSARIVFQFVPSTIKIVGFIVSHLVFHIERQHVSWCIVRGASNSYPFSLKIAAVLYSWMAHKGAI